MNLNNTLSRKRIDFYEISDKCNNNGEIKINFDNTIEYDDNFDYYVSITRFDCNSFFPNLTKDNNKFYYSEPNSNVIKIIELENGAYEISDYNTIIQQHVKDNIKIDIASGIGKSIIFLKPGFKVYFDKPNTWRTCLGFDEVILDKPINYSNKMINILSIQKIYISCNIAKGSLYNGKDSQIIYSFSNDVNWGNNISIRPQNLENHLLVDKRFNNFIITFKDDQNNSVDFLKSPVSLTLEIKQV